MDKRKFLVTEFLILLSFIGYIIIFKSRKVNIIWDILLTVILFISIVFLILINKKIARLEGFINSQSLATSQNEDIKNRTERSRMLIKRLSNLSSFLIKLIIFSAITYIILSGLLYGIFESGS